MRCLVCLSLLIVATSLRLTGPVSAVDDAIPPGDFNDKVDAKLKGRGGSATVRFPIGRTRRGTLIWCLAEPEALDVRSNGQRVLIVGGLDGSDTSIDAALDLISARFPDGSKIAIACVPMVNPDGWATGRGSRNFSGGVVDSGYPPTEASYNSSTIPESQFLWRFIGWFAPDQVIEVHDATAPEWRAVQRGEKRADQAWPTDSLAFQVNQKQFGVHRARTSAMRIVANGGLAAIDLPNLLQLMQAVREVRLKLSLDPVAEYALGNALSGEDAWRYRHSTGPSQDRPLHSPLRESALQCLQRSPVEIAQQLAAQYGHHLQTVMYQPALALVSRVRLAELTGNDQHRQDVNQIVGNYVDGTSSSLGEKVSGSHLAGHLVFAEYARLNPDSRYVDLVKAAADYGFDDQGEPREAMPFHNEMSDAVFMACPILTAAGRFTKDERYFDMALRHLRFMTDLCVREDGIYRHSPLCEAAWGRGNGFPALGLALCLADLDAVADRSAVAAEARNVMLPAFRAHLQALLPHQDVTGMWQQVIDDPGSYREMTATCMISYAIVRGIRSGWLDESTYAPVAKRAWEAVKVRIGADGTLFDVCTGTGKQKTLWDYRDRTAILGKDERGGAMALMFAVEMAAWEAEQPNREPSSQ